MKQVLGVILTLAMAYPLSGCIARSCGMKWVHECPEQTLSPAEVEALYKKGQAATKEDMIGEYHMISSLEAGLPLLEVAAMHGHIPAMKAYGGHFTRIGAVEMGSLMWLSQPDATAEGMMWSILKVHLGEEVMEHDKETYRVLLDPTIPFPEGFFESSSGTAWMFQMLSSSGLDWAREQAYAWRGCWPK
jgi:hypothetical protein